MPPDEIKIIIVLMKKIAFVDHFYGKRIGGGEEYLIMAAEGIQERGFAPTIICLPDSALAKEAKKRGIDVVEVQFYLPNVFMAARRLKRVLEAADYNIVHTHGYYSGLVGRRAARKAGIRHIVNTVHIEVVPRFSGSFKARVIRYLRNFIETMTAGDIVYVAVSEEILRQLKIIGISAEKIRVIYPGISFWCYPDRLNEGEKKKVVFGSAGRLVAVKDFATLIRAFSRVFKKGKLVELAIYGEGPEKEMLKNVARSEGVAGIVHFPGYKQKEEIYKNIDVFVMSSLSEGFPLALLEAASCGLPCICTSAGGQVEIIKNDETGIVVPPADVSALSEAMNWVIDNYDAARQMGEKARTHIAGRFSRERMVEEHVKLYTEILG